MDRRFSVGKTEADKEAWSGIITAVLLNSFTGSGLSYHLKVYIDRGNKLLFYFHLKLEF